MSKRKGITIGKTRSALYGLARFLGDVQAVRRGRILPRVWNRVVGRLLSRAKWKI